LPRQVANKRVLCQRILVLKSFVKREFRWVIRALSRVSLGCHLATRIEPEG